MDTRAQSSKQYDGRAGNGTLIPPQHTLGHLDCPACDSARTSNVTPKINQDTIFSEAAEQWIKSRTLGTGKGRARYIAPGTITSYQEYIRSLNRFFKVLPLGKIHVGHLKEYQLMRSIGQLGTPADVVVERCAKQKKRTVEQLKSDPILWQWVQEKLERSHVEVSPNKINQEITLLITILKRANLWTAEMKEEFEHLQWQENDIPRALTPEEQDRWLVTAGSRSEWRKVYLYSTLALRATATNVEMRNLRLCHAFEETGIIQIQALTAKNKYRPRTIPLPPDAHWALRELIADARELGSFEPQHHLFPFRIARGNFDPSRPMSNSGMKKPWDEVRKAAGLPNFRIHDCRHTAITRLAEAGTPIAVIMSMSGHISAKMIRHYTQISEHAQRLAVNAAYEGKIYRIPRRPMQHVSAGGYPVRQSENAVRRFSS